MSKEPAVEHAGVRNALYEFHIECRMSDGQKGAFITVDHDFPELAHLIVKLLTTHFENSPRQRLLNLMPVPKDFPVQPIDPQDPRATVCGTCLRGWDDSIATEWTPTPSGRCPFEYFHGADHGPTSSPSE